MFFSKVLLFLAAATDVFGHSLHKSPEVGIEGGHPVRIWDVPYMANLRRDDGYHWCGASIVHKRFVLTAAHCIEPNVTYIVSVGSEYAHRGDIYEVEKVIPHENFTGALDYDICLVKLAKALKFGPNVQPIDLAALPLVIEPGFTFDVTGWGRPSPQEHESDILRQVTVPFLAESECKHKYKDYVSEQIICAGEINGGKGTCYGDAGSPLVYKQTDTHFIQIGITSYNDDCGNNPVIFTKLAFFEDWIMNAIRRN